MSASRMFLANELTACQRQLANSSRYHHGRKAEEAARSPAFVSVPYLDSCRVFGEVKEPLRWSVEDVPVNVQQTVRTAGDNTLHHASCHPSAPRTKPTWVNSASEPRSDPERRPETQPAGLFSVFCCVAFHAWVSDRKWWCC